MTATDDFLPPMDEYQSGTSISQVTIGPAQASELLKHNTRNRAISNYTLRRWRNAVQRGEWRFHTDPIHVFHVEETGETVLINGQHRLLTVINANRTLPFTLAITTGSAEECAELFANYDRGKGRTAADAVKAVIDGGLDLKGQAPKNLAAVGTAISLLEVYFTQGINQFRSLSSYYISQVIQEHAEEAVWGVELRNSFRLNVKIRRQMPMGLLAAAISQRRISPELADEFWDHVIMGNDLPSRSPQLALRQSFISQAGSGKGYDNHIQNNLRWYDRGNIAWNAFIEGREVVVLRTSTNNPIHARTPNTRTRGTLFHQPTTSENEVAAD